MKKKPFVRSYTVIGSSCECEKIEANRNDMRDWLLNDLLKDIVIADLTPEEVTKLRKKVEELKKKGRQ